MGLFIEPGLTSVEVAGEEIEVKILTARDRVALLRIGAMISEMAVGEEVTPTVAAEIQALHLDALELSLPDGPDGVNIRHWPELVGLIFRANQLSGDDAKN